MGRGRSVGDRLLGGWFVTGRSGDLIPDRAGDSFTVGRICRLVQAGPFIQEFGLVLNCTPGNNNVNKSL